MVIMVKNNVHPKIPKYMTHENRYHVGDENERVKPTRVSNALINTIIGHYPLQVGANMY